MNINNKNNPGPEPQSLPPSDINNKILPIINLNKNFYRIHKKEYGAVYFGKKRLFRFDDPEQKFGVLYLAETASGAYIETYKNCSLVTVEELKKRNISIIKLARQIKVVDLTQGSSFVQLGLDGRICTSEYQIFQVWAKAFYYHPSKPDGIYYFSRHNHNENCLVLFDRAEDLIETKLLQCLWNPSDHTLLKQILDHYKIGLI